MGYIFLVFLHNYNKFLLASLYLPLQHIGASSTGQISVKFGTGGLLWKSGEKIQI